MRIHQEEVDPESLVPVPTTKSEDAHVEKPTATEVDAVFGEITEDGPNYRNVGWLGTSALLMKTQIGLGVLSIPSSFDALGMIPGIICLITIGAILTWSNYMIGVFKINHREVHGIDDAVGVMFGRIGRELMGVAFCLYLTFAAGSGLLGISIAFNALSTHGTCTAVFVAVAAVLTICRSSIRTLGRLSWLAWFGVVTIIVALLIVTVAVGVQERPDEAPQDGPWVSDYKLFNNPTFAQAIPAISTFIFAYSGTPWFFPIVSEMRNPRDYTKAMLFCQVVVTTSFLTIGIVLYYFCGSYVASPALGSAGKLLKQISYGVALPSLVLSATLSVHMVGKFLFLRFLRGTRHLTSNTPTHWITWLSCICAVAVIAYIVASAIPSFGDLVSLIGALLGTLMCFQPLGCMWLYDNWNNKRTWRWTFMACWSTFVILVGTFLMVAGTYGSVQSIADTYKQTKGSAAWSCADNSNST